MRNMKGKIDNQKNPLRISFFITQFRNPTAYRVFPVERDCYRKRQGEKETSLDRRPVSDL